MCRCGPTALLKWVHTLFIEKLSEEVDLVLDSCESMGESNISGYILMHAQGLPSFGWALLRVCMGIPNMRGMAIHLPVEHNFLTFYCLRFVQSLSTVGSHLQP